jgi:ADP-ribosyl-[dinitrogen reductase] hydrolase
MNSDNQGSRKSITTQIAIGAFVGGAVGDALGAPFEFKSGGLYSSTFPAAVVGGLGEMLGGGGWGPGEFTDDTQMAIALAESLIANRGINSADLWDRWRAWASSANDVGILTRRALSSESFEGAALNAEVSNGGKSAGNGSVMRNTPIALFLFDHPLSVVIEAAIAQSALTHNDPQAGFGAAIHAAMICAGIQGADMFGAIDDALALLPLEASETWAPLLHNGWTPAESKLTNGTVWTCLAQAVWALRTSSTFEEAVTKAIDLGDDADTVGCVAGSLAGARWGIQSIPSRWTTYLNGSVATPLDGGGIETRTYNYNALQELARALMGREKIGPTPPDDPGGPTRVHDTLPIYAADLQGASKAPTDWAVISLCRPEGHFENHPVRREVFLIDRDDATDNHNVLAALNDAVGSIDAFLAENPDRELLVHCHGGRSRTAFVLKAWAMKRNGWSEEEAHEWLFSSWEKANRRNPTFLSILRNDWGQ